MKEIYPFQPDTVEVFRVGDETDLILRKDIQETQLADPETGSSYTAYTCEEKQFRYDGELSAAEVERDFDTWWAYTSPPPAPLPEELPERVVRLEENTADIVHALEALRQTSAETARAMDTMLGISP